MRSYSAEDELGLEGIDVERIERFLTKLGVTCLQSTAALLFLRIVGLDIPWKWVFCPLWIPAVTTFSMLLVVVAIAACTGRLK